MKSVCALAVFVAGMVSLQGCGSSGDDTPVGPICDYGQADRFVCPGHGSREVLLAVFNDLVDADAKEVRFAGDIMNISTAAWSVMAILDEATCSGTVDFRVPGNPNPPPNPLTATVSSSLAVEQDCKSPLKYVIGFSDPAGSPGALVNQWVQADEIESHVESTNISCPARLAGVFVGRSRSLGSGEKRVTIEGSSMNIRPGASSEDVWTVNAAIDASTCSATVDFNVDGKLGPGSPTLLAQIRLSVSAGQTAQDEEASPSYYIMFTDPTEKVRPGPLNQWVQVPPFVITT